MAGLAPAMPLRVSRIGGAVLTILLCASATVRAEFKLDPQRRDELRVRAQMQNLHRSMMLAERNVAAAMAQQDNARLLLASEYLGLATSKFAGPEHPCQEAVQGLHEAIVAAGLVIDSDAMTVKIDDEKTISLRPDHGTIRKWYDDGFEKYVKKLSDCEEQVGVGSTQRLMPDRFPWAN